MRQFNLAGQLSENYQDVLVLNDFEPLNPTIKENLKTTPKITLNDIEGWEKPVPLKEETAPELDPGLLTGIIGEMARAVSTVLVV